MKRPHRRLGAEADREQSRDQHLLTVRDVGREPAERLDVRRAGVGTQQQEPDEHHSRSSHGHDEESARGAPSTDGIVLVAPIRDDEPHRDQHELEEDEEDDGVEGDEGADAAGLDQQQQPDQPTTASARRSPSQQGDHAAPRQQRGEHDQRRRQRVGAEPPPDVDRLDPCGVGLEVVTGGAGRHRDPHTDRPRQHQGRGSEARPGGALAVAAHRDDHERGDRRDGHHDLESTECHDVSPTMSASTTAPRATAVR